MISCRAVGLPVSFRTAALNLDVGVDVYQTAGIELRGDNWNTTSLRQTATTGPDATQSNIRRMTDGMALAGLSPRRNSKALGVAL